MGASDFNTSIKMRISDEQTLELIKFIEHYTVERRKRYQEKHDCWYFAGADYNVDTKGDWHIYLSGPYGIMPGPLFDLDFFECLSDAFPDSWFKGVIEGWDPGAEQRVEAELKKGKLKLKYRYEEYGEDNEDPEWDETYIPKPKK